MKRLSRTSFRFSAKDPDKEKGVPDPGASNPPQPPSPQPTTSADSMRELRDFLAEADLAEYVEPLGARLKVTTVEHLKYVREEDLEEIGMTRPEMRRLKKFYRKEFPSGAIGKLRKAILRGGSDAGSQQSSGSGSRALSPSSPNHGVPLISHPRPIGQLAIAADALQLQTSASPLGEGDFGVVHNATWTTDGREKLTVAAKRLHQDMVPGDQDIMKEARPLHDLDHNNLVKLYGVVHDTADESWTLVTELAPLGSLLVRLRDPDTRQDTPLPKLCDYAQQICEGMAFLEARKIVHRDLAARNILVFTLAQVKIGDIGISKMLNAGPDSPDSNFWYSSKLPVAWYAPETIKSSEFSSASDVWSFGVLLWEMFTYGKQPWAELTSSQVLEAVDEPSCLRLEQPSLCTGDIYQLMCQCWQHQPQLRPSFASMGLSLPQSRPTLVKALKDSPETTEPDYLQYKSGSIIIVIDKCPNTSAPRGLVWRGVMNNGATGLFDPTNVIPFIETKVSPIPAKTTASLARKESGRKPTKKLRADMISEPQNDLRHTGHIGFDGAVFGDVSFIGDAYDKLPVKMEGGAMAGGLASSRVSVQRSMDSPDRNGHVKDYNSDESLDKTNKADIGHSWLSRDSLNSQSTMQSEGKDDRNLYLDVEDDSLFSDFKMPDLGSSFDLGPSFMDEVLKALDEKERQVTEKNGDIESNTKETSNADSGHALNQTARAEPPKEKKQAKVKPMSASDERMVDEAMTRSREMATPPVSPGDKGGGTHPAFFHDDNPGLLSKLKNTIKRNGVEDEHRTRHRTFSDELEHKGDLDDEVTPEAQQAYNMLVVKGSFKEKTPPQDVSDAGKDRPRAYMNEGVTSNRVEHQLYSNSGPKVPAWAEPDIIKDSRHKDVSHQQRGKISSPIAISAPIPQNPPFKSQQQSSPPVPASRASTTPPTTAAKIPPVPAPRPAVKVDSLKRSEIPVARPRPEIQRVEPTVRQVIVPPGSPEIPPKKPVTDSSHIPVLARDVKEKEREEFKRTIEIVRVDADSGSLRDDLSDRAASTSFDRSSARSSQRSSLDRSDNISENAESERADWEQSECSSNSSNHKHLVGGSDHFERGDHFGIGGGNTNYSITTSTPSSSSLQVDRKDSVTRKLSGSSSSGVSTTTPSSIFEEDLSEPSPQEIMSKLRERRLNRHLDHQRMASAAASGDGDTTVSSTTTNIPRPRPSAREPQGIPGRTPSVDLDESCSSGIGDSAENDEVDTNPLRMLRGGAIPIRSGRTSSSGNHGSADGNNGNPSTNSVTSSPSASLSLFSESSFHRNQCAEASVPIVERCPAEGDSVPSQLGDAAAQLPQEAVPDIADSSIHPTNPSDAVLSTQHNIEVERLTHTLMQGDLASVASAVVDKGSSKHTTTAEGELQKFTSSGALLNLSTHSLTGSLVQAESQSSESLTSSISNVKNTLPQPVNNVMSKSDTLTLNNSNVFERKNNRVGVDSDSHGISLNTHEPSQVAEASKDMAKSDIAEGNSEEETTIDPTNEDSNHGIDTSVAPPRLPPRRSKSMNENLEQTVGIPSGPSFGKVMYRRANSAAAPAIPPRDPQPSSSKIPLNTRPRERRFPLLINPPICSSPPSQPTVSTSQRQTVCHTQPSPAPPLAPSHLHPPQRRSPPRRLPPPIVAPPHTIVDGLCTPSPVTPDSPFRHHHLGYGSSPDHIQSMELPPTYDLSISPEFNDRVSGATQSDTESTHMLLDPHRPHPNNVPPPPLTVRLPTSDEPTHVALSTLSWSASFPSPHTDSQQRDLSGNLGHTGDSHGADPPSQTNESGSPSFDLPPAPPTPSYRQRLGLVTGAGNRTCSSSTQGRRSVQRSLSHSSAAQHAIHAHDGLLLAADLVSSYPCGRQHHHSSPGAGAIHPQHGFPCRSQNFPRRPSGGSDPNISGTIFSEAPSVPHPYSQTPFHPITTTASAIAASSTMSSNPDSTIYSTIVSQQQLTCQSPPIPPRNLPHRTSSQSTAHSRQPPVSPPRSSSHAVMQAHLGSRGSSQSPPPHHINISKRRGDQTPQLFRFPDTTNSRSTHNRLSSSPSPLLHTSTAANRTCPKPNESQSHLKPYPLRLSSTARSKHTLVKGREREVEEEAEVSPPMFDSFATGSSASYEDLRHFAQQRQKNCEEIEELLKIFPNEVTVEECVLALEGTSWDVSRAKKYLQLKKLLSLGLADIRQCKSALVTAGWDIHKAADSLLESGIAVRGADSGTSAHNGKQAQQAASTPSPSSSSSSSVSSQSATASRSTPLRSSPAGTA